MKCIVPVIEPSQMDKDFLSIIRDSVDLAILQACRRYDYPHCTVLDIAPQPNGGAAKYFKRATIETLDINPEAKPTFVRDLCNEYLIDVETKERFDAIICTEVLEHTNKPWIAVDNLCWMLKPGGRLYVTTPFNFRIHGPLPDNWRFTEQGLRQLFSKEDWQITSLESVETPDRPLMPIHYRLIAFKEWQ